MRYSDKISHFWVCYGIADVISYFFDGSFYPALISFIIGVAYEFYQKKTNTGRFEYLDMLADGAGIGVWILRGLM